MKRLTSRTLKPRSMLAAAVALLAVPILAVGAFAAGGGQSQLDAVRNATAAFHDIAAAEAAGYGPFYICTDENGGAGAMGQHYANIDLVLDPAIDPLRPEVLVYEPKPDGTYRLVGVEYVVFQDLWHDAFGAGTPSVLGVDMKPIPAGNRYGLPDFYERHAWIWRPNPRGMFDDWNSKVSCRGNGDPA
jgi:hypothetical protein